MRQRLRQAKADVSTMRRVFPAAERIARADGRAEPGADDLVLAALDLPDRAARRALADCGIDAATLRTATTAVRGTPAPPLEGDPPKRPYRSEPSMQMTFQRAVGNAKAERSHVRSGDILLAAIDPEAGVVSRGARRPRRRP